MEVEATPEEEGPAMAQFLEEEDRSYQVGSIRVVVL